MRIVITGYPNSGKTTLANMLLLIDSSVAWDLKQTDRLVDGREWSAISSEVAKWMDEPGPWIIEGVAAARAIRKWRANHTPFEKAPLDMFIYMRRELNGYRPGQRAMANGMDTVMTELWKWMIDKDVIVIELGPNRIMEEVE